MQPQPIHSIPSLFQKKKTNGHLTAVSYRGICKEEEFSMHIFLKRKLQKSCKICLLISPRLLDLTWPDLPFSVISLAWKVVYKLTFCMGARPVALIFMRNTISSVKSPCIQMSCSRMVLCADAYSPKNLGCNKCLYCVDSALCIK